MLGNKRLDKGFFFWFVVDDVFKRCYSTDHGTWISTFFTFFLGHAGDDLRIFGYFI